MENIKFIYINYSNPVIDMCFIIVFKNKKYVNINILNGRIFLYHFDISLQVLEIHYPVVWFIFNSNI